MIEIDGSMHEGGGQIIRTALALSAITGKPFKAKDIRKGREQPGLKAQHMWGVKALQQLTDAKAEKAEIESTELTFYPGELRSRNISIDIGTAGSITLLMQSLLLPSLFAPGMIRLKIIGGTDVPWSPSVDYFANVYLPVISRYAKDIKFKLERRGYYPKGGGKVDLIIHPLSKEEREKILPLSLQQQGTLVQVKGVSHASADLAKAEVAERQARTAKLELSKLNCPIDIRTEYQNTLSTGSGITLWALFDDGKGTIILGADSLGERNKKAEQVGKEAADKLLEEISSGAAVDSHMSDQLVPFLELFGGETNGKVTPHVLANKYVCRKLLDTPQTI